jgi:acetophenone carboxylase
MSGARRRITEALDLDVETRQWRCNRCDEVLGDASRNYKEFCLLHDRDPREIHLPFREPTPFSFSPDPDWCRIVEFYCPSCGVLFDVEYLPPGHPITHDIEIDLEALDELRSPATQAAAGRSLAGARSLASEPVDQ